MSKKIRNLHDLIEAVKMLPFALVIMGYAFLAAKAAVWLITNGWPVWIALCAMAAIIFFGMWQAYLFYTKSPFGKDDEKNPPDKESQRDSKS